MTPWPGHGADGSQSVVHAVVDSLWWHAGHAPREVCEGMLEAVALAMEPPPGVTPGEFVRQTLRLLGGYTGRIRRAVTGGAALGEVPGLPDPLGPAGSAVLAMIGGSHGDADVLTRSIAAQIDAGDLPVIRPLTDALAAAGAVLRYACDTPRAEPLDDLVVPVDLSGEEA